MWSLESELWFCDRRYKLCLYRDACRAGDKENSGLRLQGWGRIAETPISLASQNLPLTVSLAEEGSAVTAGSVKGHAVPLPC